ncbi:MAG: response regulator [Pseudanabaena sp.]|jgi:two-component system sensor histidine kinase/response regulator|nr:response regulator [Pseudanabaena sp. M53BS1SP1A06MG]MCA6583583.1 response regulator [Pseudanabaena sp. M34BS1SP1A06MG]MCA6586828.1 response regulator [Pseudanabaena sp. M051S1SP1A06QC]MCA6590094.1 response regulator [Pseudanabaena sp. M109S1SP1A06QC]MCA6590726.1 response regulator [Pseudanabaena sp. M38BS1SP1A06MG]MCA6595538.1 response regulator [Pseudanabaena sp. M046S1SP1A06QC]MCA6600081.1 response regulator [Pseudanabaena sp. M57BS1SP1A06MG]MCA6603115.1 response regulator [Pseudanabae
MGNQPVVLVIDDEPANFDVIEILLFKEGYELYYKDNGAEALDSILEIKPDIILLDVMMPDMDGIEVCQHLKKNPLFHHISIIIVTALSDKEDLARCLDAGADDFISKPINSIELRARMRSMLRIKRQYDRIQDTMQLRAEMMQTIVHDLRNPLIGIMLGCDSLKSLGLPDRAQKRLDQISQTIEQMRLLIDDILTIGRIEAKKLFLDLSNIDIVDMAKSVIDDFEPLTSSKQITVLGKFPQETAYISADKNLIRRVLDNLMDNAIKFSPQQSFIILQIECLPRNPDRPDLVKIQVIDSGIGISPEQKQVIFEKYEVGNIVTGVAQIGLGLSFCKMTVEAHHGEISATNNQSQGATFTILLRRVVPDE